MARGEAVAFEGRDEAGKWFVWSTNRFKSGYIGAINPQLSSDGKHLAFITGELKDGEMQTVYVVDDRQLKLEGYGNVTAGRFSPDGVVFCFVAETKGKKSKLLIEQTVCAEFDGMVQVAPILKRPDSTLWYIVKQGKELYRLELEKAS